MMQVEQAMERQNVHHSAFIHSMAMVDNTVKIGANSHIWQFASIIRGAVIGDDTNVASGACVDGSHIGSRCVIAHNLAMGPGFWISDEVFIGPNCTFCNDSWPRTHKIGFRPEEFNENTHAVLVQRGASIGANSVILPGVTIGERAMIAAGSRVDRDVPAGHLWKDGNSRPTHERIDRMKFAYKGSQR